MHTVFVTARLPAGKAANGGLGHKAAALDNNAMAADAKAQVKARKSAAAHKVGEPSVGDMSEPTDEPSTPTAAVAPADQEPTVSLFSLCLYSTSHPPSV